MRPHVAICFLVLFALAIRGIAQEGTSRRALDSIRSAAPERTYGIFSAAGGVAIPTGPFTYKDIRDQTSGFAKVGYTVQFLEASHFIHKHFGWGVRWNRHQFAMDHEAMAQWYEDRIPFLEFFARSEDPWTMHTAIAHAVGVMPTPLVDLDVRLGLGFATIYRPSVLIEGYDRTTGYFSFSRQQEDDRANTLVYGIGTNLRWHIDRDIDVLFAWDHQWMRPRFSVKEVAARTYDNVIEWEQPVGVMTFVLGAGIRL